MTMSIASAEVCASMCTLEDRCKSFDHSAKQQRCILHSDIEGPPTPSGASYRNNFATVSLQSSQDFLHYERLGVGNSTLHTFTGLNLRHRQRFYVNMRLRNKLGYENYVSSPAVVVDLTPPTPGRIRNAIRDELLPDGCGFNPLQRCIGTITSVPTHR